MGFNSAFKQFKWPHPQCVKNNIAVWAYQYTYMHTYIHTSMHTSMHTYIHAYMHASTRKHIIYIYTHTYIHTCVCTSVCVTSCPSPATLFTVMLLCQSCTVLRTTARILVLQFWPMFKCSMYQKSDPFPYSQMAFCLSILSMASLRFSTLLWGEVVSLMPNPQPGGPGYPFSSG